MSAILVEIIQILIGGLTAIGQGIGSGLQTLVNSVFIDSSGTTPALSTFGGVIAIFGGIALAISLSTLVVKWIMSLGARN